MHEIPDDRGKHMVVSCWKYLHFREAPQTEACVIQVQREATYGIKRDPRGSRFIWVRSHEVPLERVYVWYRKRFLQEYEYRFLKQDLLWLQAHQHTLEQMELWSWIVACACNQLLLCQRSGLVVLHPWENRQCVITLRQVQRVMPSILQQVGTLTTTVQTARKVALLAKGRKRTRAPRFEVVRKPKPVPKTRRKRA